MSSSSCFANGANIAATIGISGIRGSEYNLGICSVGEIICDRKKFICPSAAFSVNDTIGIELLSAALEPKGAKLQPCHDEDGDALVTVEAVFFLNGKQINISPRVPTHLIKPSHVKLYPTILMRGNKHSCVKVTGSQSLTEKMAFPIKSELDALPVRQNGI